MSFFDAETLAIMRADVARMLPDTCVIEAISGSVPNGAGGQADTWAAVSGGTVACRVDPLKTRGDKIVIQSLREVTELRYQLTVPYDAPITQACRVVHDTHTYQIIQLDADHSENVSKRAIIAEVRS
jgi:head-tail adaptor